MCWASPLRVSPLAGQLDPCDLAFMVNSMYFWFDHEVDQNFVELTIASCPTHQKPAMLRRLPEPGRTFQAQVDLDASPPIDPPDAARSGARLVRLHPSGAQRADCPCAGRDL
jgi:hypothetical protein